MKTEQIFCSDASILGTRQKINPLKLSGRDMPDFCLFSADGMNRGSYLFPGPLSAGPVRMIPHTVQFISESVAGYSKAVSKYQQIGKILFPAGGFRHSAKNNGSVSSG